MKLAIAILGVLLYIAGSELIDRSWTKENFLPSSSVNVVRRSELAAVLIWGGMGCGVWVLWNWFS